VKKTSGAYEREIIIEIIIERRRRENRGEIFLFIGGSCFVSI